MSEQTTAPECYRHPGRETWIRCQRCDRPICPDCMLPAAVGFQCPSCVKEGAKSTRSGVSPYGGQRSANPALTSFALIALNVAVWLAIVADGGQYSGLIGKLELIPDWGFRFFNDGSNAMPIEGVATGAWWQVITSAFTHEAAIHIGFNMVALYFLGPQLELMMGRARFLAVYLVSALTASAAVMLFSHPNSATLGASGAIFGVMGAFLVVAMKAGGDVRNMLMWIGLNVVLTFTISNISWQGHLGGLLGGILVAGAITYAPKARRAWFQWGGVALVAVAALALIVIRAQSFTGPVPALN